MVIGLPWIGSAQTSFAESSNEIAAVPDYKGPLHVKCVLHQRDARTAKLVEDEYKASDAKDLDTLKARGLSSAQIDNQRKSVTDLRKQEEKPQERDIELWSSHGKWLLRETNPAIKGDVFAGENPGTTWWLCDGQTLARIEDNGFSCILFRKGYRINQFPDLPPLGFGYDGMPLAIRDLTRTANVSRLPRFSGWVAAAVPSYTSFDADPLDSGEMNDDPLHFTNYNAGYLKLDQDGQVVDQIDVGLPQHPIERWEFGGLRSVGGRDVAFHSVWNNFDPSMPTTPMLVKDFAITSFDTVSIPDSFFSTDRYIKEGAEVQVPFDPEQRPNIITYTRGASWQKMGATNRAPATNGSGNRPRS